MTTKKNNIKKKLMGNKIQFLYNREQKKKQKEFQRSEYLEKKYGYKSQNNYPYSW